MADFTSANPHNVGELGVELLAQARPNGQVLDHFRVTVGGSRIIEAKFHLAKLHLTPVTSPWRMRFQRWPRDLEIRRNMTTTTWESVATLLASREAAIIDEEDQIVATETALEYLEKEGKMASIRFAVVIGEDTKMQLLLQGLPASAEALMGKPALRG